MSSLEALIVRSNAEVLSLNAPEDTSSPVHMPSQQSFQPEDSSSPVDMQIQQSIQSGNSDDSYGTHQFENMHPQFNYNGGHYNWGMQQPYWNYNSHLMNSSYQTPSTVPEFPSQQNIGAITSYRPNESHHLQLHAESSSGPSTSRDSSSYYATDSPSSLPIPKKVNHDKEKYFSDLAKINEMLSMIDKKINPVDEWIEEIDEGIASLPLKNLVLEAFEKILKKDENLKKLVSFQ
ncbi:uncharacterized protein LOC130686996 [Daphnia carinata]|uniref:uncharacterized protein LOC130686996 n=1 Tax=Daphnia carinata TaxID=120202 RepID=UPI00257D57C5|nr:uncharacterized protein LOC130686996 [Daphnia carinata]